MGNPQGRYILQPSGEPTGERSLIREQDLIVNHEVIEWVMNKTFINTSIYTEWKLGCIDYDQ